MADVPGDRGRRPIALAFLVLGIASSVLVTLVMGFFTQLHCDGGDGGSPYVARDSAQADVCAATGNGLGVMIAAVPLLVGVERLARRLLTAWTERHRRLRAALASVVMMPLMPLLVTWAHALPSDHCSADKQAAFDTWRQAAAYPLRTGGSHGSPPYDCETY